MDEAEMPGPTRPPPEPGIPVRRSGAAIHLHRDRGTVWLVRFFGLLILCLVAGLFLGRFARTESVRGYVSGASGLIRLDAQAPGIVTRIAVRQGEAVRQGQLLMQLRLREPTTGGVSTVTANLASLRARQANLQRERDRLAAYLDSTRNDRADTEANVAGVVRAFDAQEATLRDGQANADAMASRVEAYLKQGYATREALNGQRRISLDYARQIAELRARRAELAQDSAERLRAQRANLTEKSAQLATAENELSAVAAQLTGLGAQSSLDILAPIDGEVAGLFVEPGASVLAEQVVAIVGEPASTPIVVLDVPARAIGLAKVGQEVVLKYDAFPFKTFGIARGTVTAIAGTPLRTPVPDSGDAQRQSTYRVEVAPHARSVRAYGVDEPIRLGSTLSADILVEKRRLIDWMLDPVRAMRGRG